MHKLGSPSLPRHGRSGNKRSASEHTKDRTGKVALRRSISSQRWRQSSQLSVFDAAISSFQKNLDLAGFDENLLESTCFRDFLNKIKCPFCLKTESDKDSLIKHLDESCSMKTKKQHGIYAVFEIYPNNAIKCNLCHNAVMSTITGYFMHLYDKNHISNHSKGVTAGKNLTDLVFCSCCKIFVIDSYTQLRCHIQHDIHDVKRKSSFKSNYFLNQGIQCIYCFYNDEKRFKCLLCSSPSFLFDTPLEIINHFENSKHIRNAKNNYFPTVAYCCFCDEEVNKYEMELHFASEKHAERENAATTEKNYELCLFCGLACNTPKDLLAHMKLNCSEISEIRQKKDENDLKEKERAVIRKLNKKRLILIKENVDQDKLLEVLKKFGDITYLGTYNKSLIIEFKNETAVELISLIQDCIKIYNKMDTVSEKAEENKSKNAQASSSICKDL